MLPANARLPSTFTLWPLQAGQGSIIAAFKRASSIQKQQTAAPASVPLSVVEGIPLLPDDVLQQVITILFCP